MEKDLERRVLNRIRPTQEETSLIDRSAAEVVRRVLEEASQHQAAAGGEIKPLVVGSVAKGTYLKEADIDIFMTFPTGASRETLEKAGLAIGKKVLEHPVVKYAEHPYVRGRIGKVNVDLVPCYAITDPEMKMSAVDRTPFQSDYVNRTMQPSQRDEVRLLKRFFKGIDVYGAEAKTSGFSGYLCELLVLAFRDFIGTVEAISGWQAGARVIVKGTEAGPRLESSNALVTLPDPVDRDRNVAAAVGPDAFSMAVMACRRYLRRPDVKFFFPKSPPDYPLASIRRAVKESGHGLLLVTIDKPDVVDDNLYPQIQKARRNLNSLLAKYEFDVNRSAFEVDGRVKILFELKGRTFPSSWLREGPAGWSENAAAFLEKHRRAGGRVVLIDGKLCSEEARPYDSPARLVSEKLQELSLGADIDGMKQSAEVSVNDDVVSAGNRRLLGRFLFPKFPWEH